MRAQDLKLLIEHHDLIFSQHDLLIRRPAGLFDRLIVTRQGIKS
jgi:hypothetical protein